MAYAETPTAIHTATQKVFAAENALGTVYKKIEECRAAHALAEKEYNHARALLEDERKAEYEKCGVTTVKYRHHDGSTYLHAPGVELAHIEWTGRRGVSKFRKDLVLAVVWSRDDPHQPTVASEVYNLENEQKKLRGELKLRQDELEKVRRESPYRTADWSYYN